MKLWNYINDIKTREKHLPDTNVAIERAQNVVSMSDERGAI